MKSESTFDFVSSLPYLLFSMTCSCNKLIDSSMHALSFTPRFQTEHLTMMTFLHFCSSLPTEFHIVDGEHGYTRH